MGKPENSSGIALLIAALVVAVISILLFIDGVSRMTGH